MPEFSESTACALTVCNRKTYVADGFPYGPGYGVHSGKSMIRQLYVGDICPGCPVFASADCYLCRVVVGCVSSVHVQVDKSSNGLVQRNLYPMLVSAGFAVPVAVPECTNISVNQRSDIFPFLGVAVRTA